MANFRRISFVSLEAQRKVVYRGVKLYLGRVVPNQGYKQLGYVEQGWMKTPFTEFPSREPKLLFEVAESATVQLRQPDGSYVAGDITTELMRTVSLITCEQVRYTVNNSWRPPEGMDRVFRAETGPVGASVNE